MPSFRLPFRRGSIPPPPPDPARCGGRDPVPLDPALHAATIGHDIRNYLTAANLAVEMAIEAVSDDDPVRADLVAAIRALDSAALLTVRLTQIGHALSRTDDSPARVDRATGVDVADVLRAIEPILRRIVSGEWTLELALPPTVGRVAMDAASLESLVVNLVVNARDAQGDGGAIELDVRERVLGPFGPAEVVISVADRGSGIPPAVRARIFEPRITTKAHGSGLGLAIVAEVVSAAGGTVEALDRDGGGTRFIVTLPQNRDEPIEGERRWSPAPRDVTMPNHPPLITRRSNRTLEISPK